MLKIAKDVLKKAQNDAEVEKLIRLFRKLTEAGNAVLVVEHREEMLEGADVKIEMGPGGGPFGGRIVEESA